MKKIKPLLFPSKKKKGFSIPDYLKEDMPNQSMLPAKHYMSSMPENIERPPAENLDHIIKQLYKEK
jgi:hypothetical protein